VTKRERPVDVDFGELYKARQALIQARLACDQAIAVLNRLTVTEPRRGSVVGIENVGTVADILTRMRKETDRMLDDNSPEEQ
jgi:hypothetical protein